MRIKRRKYGIGARLTFRGIEKSATRRLGKSPNEDKVTLGNAIICGSTIFLVKFDYLPESLPCRELLTVVIAVDRFPMPPIWSDRIWLRQDGISGTP